MRILAFDTSMGACSAAVWVDGVVTTEEFALQARGQAETLIPMIGRVLADSGLQVEALDRVGVSLGPGTFTGVRVAVAAARALVLGTSVKTGGVTSLHAMARGIVDGSNNAGAEDHQAIAVISDARRGEVYIQLFDSEAKPLAGAAVLPPCDVAAYVGRFLPADARTLRLAGTGARLVAGELTGLPVPVALDEVSLQPAARHIAPLIAQLPMDELGLLLPLYLRPPDAKKPAPLPFVSAGAERGAP